MLREKHALIFYDNFIGTSINKSSVLLSAIIFNVSVSVTPKPSLSFKAIPLIVTSPLITKAYTPFSGLFN